MRLYCEISKNMYQSLSHVYVVFQIITESYCKSSTIYTIVDIRIPGIEGKGETCSKSQFELGLSLSQLEAIGNPNWEKTAWLHSLLWLPFGQTQSETRRQHSTYKSDTLDKKQNEEGGGSEVR